MVEKTFCNICIKTIWGNAKAICCDICNNWVHIKCNSISSARYDELSNSNESFFCLKCFKEALPFGSQNNDDFEKTVVLGVNKDFKLEQDKYTMDPGDNCIINMLLFNQSPN